MTQSRIKKGRPSKYSPKTVRTICKAVAAGLPFKYAALRAGISHETLIRWQRDFPELNQAIDRAMAKGIETRLERLARTAQKGNPKSDMWWLERMVSEFYPTSKRAESEEVIATVPASGPHEACQQQPCIPRSVLSREQALASMRKYIALVDQMKAKDMDRITANDAATVPGNSGSSGEGDSDGS